MTQSGISQHILKLEEQLGTQLFIRVNKKVILTENGRKFHQYLEAYRDQTVALKESLGLTQMEVAGKVSYAMPESCLMSPHFSMLLEERKKNFPKIELSVNLCPSDLVLDKLLENKIDFGFVTKQIINPAIQFTPFCQEEYILVGHDKKTLDSISSKTILEQNFIFYPGFDVIFDCWRKKYFPKATRLGPLMLKNIGEMSSLYGVLQMLLSGVGITVIPRHCVSQYVEDKKLFVYGDEDTQALNQIFIATLTNIHLPQRAKIVIETFTHFKN